MATVTVNLTNLKKLKDTISRQAQRTVKVGVRAGATYPNGTSVAEVASYLNYGWMQTVTKEQSGWLGAHGAHVKVGSTLTMPPRPFFRAAIEAKRQDIAKVTEMAKAVLNNITENTPQKIEKALKLLGTIGVEAVQDAIADGSAGNVSFAIRSPVTMMLYGNMLKTGGHRTDDTPNNSSTTRKPLKKQGILFGSIIYEIED